MKRLFFKNKVIAIFSLFVFLFAQITPTNNAYAFDINQAIGNIMDITKGISDAIEKLGGGVIKAGIATALNSFAQTLATNTVDQVANGGKGQQPLFAQFSLEDTLKMAIDDATGSIIDRIATSGPEGQRLIDNVCTPMDANITWRLQMTLNIFPDFKAQKTNIFLAHKCTISTIITSIKSSIENISNNLRKTFMTDCFNEFAPDMFAGFNDPESSLSSSASASWNSVVKSLSGSIPASYSEIKSRYLYDVVSISDSGSARASYFTIKKVFYKQKEVNTSCTSYTGESTGSKFCTLDEFARANDKQYCETEKQLLSGTNSTSILGTTIGIESTDTADCLSYTLPVKDPIAKVYKADISKQKKFLNQYKSCYLKKMNEAFNSFLVIGNAPSLAKDDPTIKRQLIKKDCATLIGSLLDYNDLTTDKNAYSAFKAFSYKDSNIDKKVSDYKKIIASAILAPKPEWNKVGNTGSGENFKNYMRSAIDFFGDFEQALINCSSVNDNSLSGCTNITKPKDSAGKELENINSDNYSVPLGEKYNTYSSAFSRLMPRVGAGADRYILIDSDAKTLTFRDDLLNSVTVPLSDNGKDLRVDSNSSNNNKIKDVMDDMVNGCLKDAESRWNLLAIGQEKENKKYIDEQKAATAKATAEAEANVRNQTPGSEYKPQKATISNQVTGLADNIQNQLNSAMNVGSNFLQPTGDLFIDPIKMFAATLLKEGSKKAMEGMFKVLFPTNDVDMDLSELNGVTDVNDAATGEAVGSCTSPGPIKKGETCGNNGQCYACYCEKRQNAFESTDSSAKNNFMTCQDSPSSSVLK